MLKRMLLPLAMALVVGSAVEAAEFRLLRLDGRLVKWGEAILGTGAEVTYAFATNRLAFPDAVNCRSLEPVDHLVERSGLSRELLEKEFAAAFRMWEVAADIRFHRVESAEAADIVIGALAEPHGVAYADVWPDRESGQPVAGITRATICLNPLIPWEMTFDGLPATADIRRVAAHEIGHTIGLDHPGRQGQLMGFRYSESSRQLRRGDRRGAATLYGEPKAPAEPR